MRKPVIHTGAVAIFRDGKIAAIRSSKHDGGVELPGGKAQRGETPEQAASREAFEECGLRVRELHEIWFGAVNGFAAHVFVGEADGDLVSSDEGEAFWATPEEVMAGTYAEYARQFIPTAVRFDSYRNAARNVGGWADEYLKHLGPKVESGDR